MRKKWTGYLMLILALISAITLQSCRQKPEDNKSSIPVEESRQAAVRFAEGEIKANAEAMPEEGWNRNTKISDELPLYDPYGNIGGYIFNLKTDGKETGNIQVFVSGTECRNVLFTFQGRSSVEKMLEEYREKTGKSTDKAKIIFIGGTDYILEDPSDKSYYDLNRQKPYSGSRDSLVREFEKLKQKILKT